jgi:hypothetical protein
MTVGFPLISLDSLVRIETYQWVTRHKPTKIFSRRLRAFEAPEREPAAEAERRQDGSWGKLNQISAFLQ